VSPRADPDVSDKEKKSLVPNRNKVYMEYKGTKTNPIKETSNEQNNYLMFLD
jgi:hypothetical protein